MKECEYYKNGNLERKNIMYTDKQAPVCIWTENNKSHLLIDDDYEENMIKINFCPMCSRKIED